MTALLLPSVGVSDAHFPPLTGRIVDSAALLSTKAESDLSTLLAAHEMVTGDQVLVVTVPSLQGLAIEDYGYRLGRHWGIGQKGRNNGVLVIVAPNERAARIEVGYGREYKLTDAVSRGILEFRMIPFFKNGDYERGIVAGTLAVLDVLGEGIQSASIPQSNDLPISSLPVLHVSEHLGWGAFVFLALFVTGQLLAISLNRRMATFIVAGAGFLIFTSMFSVVAGVVDAMLLTLMNQIRVKRGVASGEGTSDGSWTSTNSADGSEFSGGGGSFGGGGASSNW